MSPRPLPNITKQTCNDFNYRSCTRMNCPQIHKCKACDNPDHGYTSCLNKSKSTWNAGRARECFPLFNPRPCLQDKHLASSHYSTSQPGTSSPSDFGHQWPSQSSTRNLFLPGLPPSAWPNSDPHCNNTPISTLGLTPSAIFTWKACLGILPPRLSRQKIYQVLTTHNRLWGFTWFYQSRSFTILPQS